MGSSTLSTRVVTSLVQRLRCYISFTRSLLEVVTRYFSSTDAGFTISPGKPFSNITGYPSYALHMLLNISLHSLVSSLHSKAKARLSQGTCLEV